MNNSLLSIIKESITKYGGTILYEPKRVFALFADLAQDVPKPQKNAFVKCLEHEFAHILKNAAEAERAYCKQQLAQRLHEEEGLDLRLCEETLELLAAVLFGEAKNQKNDNVFSVSQTEQLPVTPTPSTDIKIIPEKGGVIPFCGLDWRILDLDKQNGKALLLSEKVIEKRAYHSSRSSITWAQCDLRSYLNEEFYNTFNANDKALVTETKITTSDDPYFGTKGGNDTTDRIFLLSAEEAIKYFGDSGQLKNRKKEHPFLSDQYDKVRIAKDTKGMDYWWWLRSPGKDSYYAAYVFGNGRISFIGSYVDGNSGGVRPALWLNLQSQFGG